jgi:nuclear pore complex protein Nup107
MEQLEPTYQGDTLRAGEEVDHFAAQLDRFSTNLTGSPAEQRAQVFKLVESYYAYTRKRLDDLRQRQPRKRSSRGASWKRTGPTDMDVDETDGGASSRHGGDDVRRIEEEAQTWDLLRRVLPLRYRDQTAAHLRNTDDSSNKTRGQWWNEFMISDSVARERKIVLEWLQSSASQGPPIDEVVSHLQRNAERGDILAHGWLHTRHKIKLQKKVSGYQGVLDHRDRSVSEAHLGSNTFVTQLDPDAVTRQARKLAPEDESFESAIWLGCFEMLRRGCSMSEIRDWCAERTELWRAASIAPLPLSNPEDEEQLDFDPGSLVLWRRMCYAAAREGGTGKYDRAVYGLLAGDLDSVEAVCKSWDDFLFANYNALLRTQFDSYLIKHGGESVAKVAQQFPAFNAVLHHSDPVTVGKRLVAKLESGPQTQTEALRPLKALQGAIVANDLDRHLLHQGLALSNHANQRDESKLIPKIDVPGFEGVNPAKYFKLTDHDGLRIVAHVLIIISTLDRLAGSTKEWGAMEAQHLCREHVIAAYISYLRLTGLEEMIPLYCSKLYGERAFEALSRNLMHIVDNDARLNQLTIMKKLGLDVGAFTKKQPAIYLEDVDDKKAKCEANGNFKILEDKPPTLKYGRVVTPDFFGEDPDSIHVDDDAIIRAMEWLLLFPEFLVETCHYVIRIYKYFLSMLLVLSIFYFVNANGLQRNKNCELHGSSASGYPDARFFGPNHPFPSGMPPRTLGRVGLTTLRMVISLPNFLKPAV